MNKRVTILSLSMIASLIVAITLLIQVNTAAAGDIDPNQAMDIVALYSGQNKTFSTTQTTQFGSHSVGVISIRNEQLTSTFTVGTPGANGFWTIIMMGTGKKRNWIDVGFGFVFPSGGLTATVDVGTGLSFGLAIGTAFVLTPPVSAEAPFSYSIKVAGTAP